MGHDRELDGEDLHQIGEAAAAVGLSLRTIRHYEEIGLVVPSARSAGGFRLYTDDDIERLRLVKQMKPLEFSLEEIRHLLDARDAIAAPDTGPEERSAQAERLAMFAVAAEERCARLRDDLAQAERVAALIRAESGDRTAPGRR